MKVLIDELSIKNVLSKLGTWNPAEGTQFLGGLFSSGTGSPNKLARGCIHSQTTLTLKNTNWGCLGIDKDSTAIISYVPPLSEDESKYVHFWPLNKQVEFRYETPGDYSMRQVFKVRFY